MRMCQFLAAAGLIPACGIAMTGVSAAEPTTGFSPADIDSVIVPIDQIAPRMTNTTVSTVPAPSPATAQDAPNPSGPCYLGGLRPDAAELFGTGLQAFRSVYYSGVSNILVNQAVGVYPDAAAAAGVVDRLVDGLSACLASGAAGLDISDIGPGRASWSGAVCGDEARAVRNVVIRVQACHMDNPAGLASTVAEAISAKAAGTD